MKQYKIFLIGLLLFLVGCQSVAPKKSISLNKQNHDYYVVKGQIIIDKQHRLMWENDKDVLERTYAVAKKSCSNLILGGHKGWRLPTAKEVVSILDYTHDRNLYPIDAFDYRLECAEEGFCWSYIWTSTMARIQLGSRKGQMVPIQVNIFDGTMFSGLGETPLMKAYGIKTKAYSKCVRSY